MAAGNPAMMGCTIDFSFPGTNLGNSNNDTCRIFTYLSPGADLTPYQTSYHYPQIGSFIVPIQITARAFQWNLNSGSSEMGIGITIDGIEYLDTFIANRQVEEPTEDKMTIFITTNVEQKIIINGTEFSADSTHICHSVNIAPFP